MSIADLKPERWEYWTSKAADDLRNRASDMVFYGQRSIWNERDSSSLLETLHRAKASLQEAESKIDDMIAHVTPEFTEAAE